MDFVEILMKSKASSRAMSPGESSSLSSLFRSKEERISKQCWKIESDIFPAEIFLGSKSEMSVLSKESSLDFGLSFCQTFKDG